MKKIIFVFLIAAAFISCDKNTIQQTTDSLKNADSLFIAANEGIKTLDSFGRKLNDSSGIARKIILPKIQKKTREIDSTYRSGGYQIDSINKEIEKITKSVVVGSDVVKTLDSANQAIKNGESALSVLTRTANKLAKRTQEQTKTSDSQPNANTSTSDKSTETSPLFENNSIVKTAQLEIEVEDLAIAKENLINQVNHSNGSINTVTFSATEGFQQEKFQIKIPLQNFDNLVENHADQLGNVRLKAINTEGTDFVGTKLSTIDITLVENSQLASTSISHDNSTENPESFSSKSTNALEKGLKGAGNLLIFILPFWPLFIIVGLVWYFIYRHKKRSAQKEVEENPILRSAEYQEAEPDPIEMVETKSKQDSTEPDYSKYLPKK